MPPSLASCYSSPWNTLSRVVENKLFALALKSNDHSHYDHHGFYHDWTIPPSVMRFSLFLSLNFGTHRDELAISSTEQVQLTNTTKSHRLQHDLAPRRKWIECRNNHLLLLYSYVDIPYSFLARGTRLIRH